MVYGAVGAVFDGYGAAVKHPKTPILCGLHHLLHQLHQLHHEYREIVEYRQYRGIYSNIGGI
jgi:hypothetical protein